MKLHVGILGILLALFAGCDAGTEATVEDCTPGEWRVCVTEDLSWGRRWCTAPGWEEACRMQECEPEESAECTTSCGTPGTRRCEADGFWGVCNHEVCDGVDNDCDGETDEELVKYCQCGCGAGESWCVDGAWAACAGDGPGSCATPPGGCADGVLGRIDQNEGKSSAGDNEKARGYDPSK